MQPQILCKAIRNREEKYLDWIKDGSKTYEGRLACKVKEWDLQINKMIIFYDENDHNSFVLCRITSLLIFNNFGEAFERLGAALIPNKAKVEVIDMYNKLFYYQDEQLHSGQTSAMIMDNKVVAIGIIVIYQQ